MQNTIAGMNNYGFVLLLWQKNRPILMIHPVVALLNIEY